MGEAWVSTEPFAFVTARPGKPISPENGLSSANPWILALSPEPDLLAKHPDPATLAAATIQYHFAILHAKLLHPAPLLERYNVSSFYSTPTCLPPTRFRLISLLEWTAAAVEPETGARKARTTVFQWLLANRVFKNANAPFFLEIWSFAKNLFLEIFSVAVCAHVVAGIAMTARLSPLPQRPCCGARGY
jgi:hypothetical protein